MSERRVPMILLVAVMAAALLPGPVEASSASFWRTDTFGAFLEGNADGVSIRQDGTLVLSPDLRGEAVPDARYAWTAVTGSGGRRYVAAGTPGKLYRLEGGEFTLLFEDDLADFPAIAVGPEGDVFVGTAPGGVVHRVTGVGSHEPFFDTGEEYIWSMVYSPEHGLVVGTGDTAMVFVVDGDGVGEMVCELDESSVISLAAIGGRVYAGTAGEGLVLDVTPGDDLRVIHDTRFDEVVGIAPGPDGLVFFAGTTVVFESTFEENGELGTGLGEGAVYVTTPSGGAREVWTSTEVPITALGAGPGGTAWAGTGSNGLVFSVDHVGEVDLIADLPDEEILSAGLSGGRAAVTTGAPATVYVVGTEPADRGAYESDVMDADAVARWGEVRWSAESGGGSLEISTRSGATAIPGELWSAWAKVDGESEGTVLSPPARFLQWKAELTRGRGDGPVLRSVEVSFLRENLPPAIAHVAVYEPWEAPFAGGGGGGPLTQTLPSGVEVTYSLEPSGGPPSINLPALVRGVRAAEWHAVDPNGDELTFSLWIRSEEEERWKLMEDELSRTAHSWDTASMPDGSYRMRVVATDRPGNSEATAATDERVSAPFLVDNTAARITSLSVSREGDGLAVDGAVEDALSPIAQVEVSVDYGEWEPAFPDDGIFDSRIEAFSLVIEEAGEGETAVAVRAVDRAGNIAVSRTVLR